ncbi:MAG: hypothetical protein AB8B91_22280 [Rubripirellula sp.]
MAKTPDFSTVLLQREWHSQWPRWINSLLAYRYVTQTLTQTTEAGRDAVEIMPQWLRGFATVDECRQVMHAAYEVSPVRGGNHHEAQYAASVAACAANHYAETSMVYASMCITHQGKCEQLAAQVILWLGPLTGPDDQEVAMDQLEELGVIPPVA